MNDTVTKPPFELLDACKDALGCMLVLKEKHPELWEMNNHAWDAEKLTDILTAAVANVESVAYRYKYINFLGDEVWSTELNLNGKLIEIQPLYVYRTPR